MTSSHKFLFRQIIFLIFLLTVFFLVKPLLISNFNKYPLIILKEEIKYQRQTLETNKTLPNIFPDKNLTLGENVFYSYSLFGDTISNTQFLRLDKLISQTNSQFDSVSAFYIYDVAGNKFKRVLVSSEEQNKARFPKTEIVSYRPLVIMFYYDVSRPVECYGPDCRSYWADFYSWNNKTYKFELVNKDFKSFYQNLLKEYEKLNNTSCHNNNENLPSQTLEELFNYNKTIYCSKSSRLELNKFIENKQKIQENLNN